MTAIPTRRAVDDVARRVADSILDGLPKEYMTYPTRINLRQVAARWNAYFDDHPQVSSAEDQAWRRMGMRGLSRPYNGQDYFGSEKAYELVSFDESVRGRFTLVHELAHVVLSKVVPEASRTLTSTEIESACDRAAALVLLPDVAVFAACRGKDPLFLELSWLEHVSRSNRISLSVLIRRLRDNAATLRLANVAILCRFAKSVRRQMNFAPRIVACCLPEGLFMPSNKRLSTSGLCNLERRFISSGLFVEDTIADSIQIWSRAQGLRRADCSVTYKVYNSRSSDMTVGQLNSRVLLGVISLDSKCVRE